MTLVLVVDDDPLVTDIVSATLEGRGYAAGVLSDASRLLQVVRDSAPALVILDCVMPGVPGLDALRALRASSFGWGIPVLVLTSRSSGADEEIALRAGASDYLRKPFDPDHLAAFVDSMLEPKTPRPNRSCAA